MHVLLQAVFMQAQLHAVFIQVLLQSAAFMQALLQAVSIVS